jgi:hypothetical protein
VKELAFSELCGFFDKQWQAVEAADAHRYTLYGGSRGPGKLLIWAEQGKVGVNVMLGCEDYPSLKDRQISKIATEFPGWMGTLQASKERGLGFHLHPSYGSGSILLRNLDDPAKYQSAEFAAILIDELTKNPERTFHILRGSLRWPGIEDVKFIGATNPHACWVRDYWIEKRLPEEMEGLEDQFVYVPGLPDDNPNLPPSYWDMLDTLPGALRQAWRYGDWYAAVEGLVYANFSEDNITDEEPDPERPIELAIDDGYVDPRAVLFIQRRGDRALVFDELYQTKRLEEETIADIIDKCHNAEWAEGREGWRLPELAAVSHEAVALRRRLRQANIPARNWMASKAGATKGSVRVERGLICDGKGHRGILVHRRCRNLLDELTMGYKYPEEPRSQNEKPLDENDHAAQALEGWGWLRMRRV